MHACFCFAVVMVELALCFLNVEMPRLRTQETRHKLKKKMTVQCPSFSLTEIWRKTRKLAHLLPMHAGKHEY